MRQGTHLKPLSQLHSSHTVVKVSGHVCTEGDGDAVQQMLRSTHAHRCRSGDHQQLHAPRAQAFVQASLLSLVEKAAS